MKRAGVVVTIIFALLALACGFGASLAALYVTQPAAKGSTVTVNFIVNKGDTTASVATNLQKDGLIRNSQAFRLLARYRKLDRGIEPGVYQLQPSMTMDQIIQKLQVGKPDQQLAGVPDSLRATQYPDNFSSLPHFSANAFLATAKTGKFSDGTFAWQTYWYVEDIKARPNVAYALEGYLYPDHFFFDTSATSDDVIKTMLSELGQKLCPNPGGKPDAYIYDQAQCISHAATVGSSNTNIFTAMESAYHEANPIKALYATLTLAGLTTREILNYKDAQGVSAVYHNRFLYAIGATGVDNGTAGYMGSDPSAQYARDTDQPPTDGHWWKDLGALGSTIDPKNPYNTESGAGHPGLPPGPIANALWDVTIQAASPAQSPYFYFVSDHCGNVHYAKTNDDFNVIVQKYVNANQCSTAIN